ncbi:hypothetical protein GGP81_001908 [Salinibacter ruber]|uniref:sulfotransferase family protein n=1 Tax=Salinibacter ruber TaxID=146919 RepID=UPI0021692D89|nr:sulfotransferase [Salinibacter ruber]MCS3955383.1 hypothetical protein [Salinibacter ruber]
MQGRSSLRPIFIFSLPRSGSTLLQRILASHSRIDTSPEPWILLPVTTTFCDGLQFGEYGHIPARKAIHNFIERTQKGASAFRAAIRQFGMTLYEHAADESVTHFIDKTPRYHLIVDEILGAFPNAKFIFLWRHPLSVVTSISETWANGSLKLGHYRVDLFKGLSKLVDASQESSPEKVHTVRYRDLAKTSEYEVRKLFEYIGLDYECKVLKEFTSVKTGEKFGDQSGKKRFDEISDASVDNWKKKISNVTQKKWCEGYLEWIGKERMNKMGYNYEKTKSDLAGLKVGVKGTVADALYVVYDKVRPWIHAPINKIYLDRISKNMNIYDVH